MKKSVVVLLFGFLILAISLSPGYAADKILDVQDLKTDSGINVWLVEDHSVPVVSMDFAFPGGLAFNPDGKEGLAYMLSIMLDEGAGELDSQAFQKELADHSIAMSFSAGRDYFNGSVKTLTRNTDKAAELLSMALNEPRFDQPAFDRMRNATEASIQQNLTSPNWIAARSYNGMLFEGDPYALPGQGTLSALAGFTPQDLKKFSKNQFVKDGLIVSMAGDITAGDAVKLVENIFGSLPKKGEITPPTNDAEFKNLGKSFLYKYENPQTHIIAGHRGISVHDEDWPAAQLINYVLGGGGFDSRLMEEIREKRGLTYGVSTYLSDMQRAPAVQASISTSNENAAEALKILKDEWKRMATTGPTDKELQNAKDYLTGSLILALTSTDAISGALNGLQQNGFDADYINRRNARLMNVTSDQVRVVAGRLLDPDKLMIMMVGNPDDIAPDTVLSEIPGVQ